MQIKDLGKFGFYSITGFRAQKRINDPSSEEMEIYIIYQTAKAEQLKPETEMDFNNLKLLIKNNGYEDPIAIRIKSMEELEVLERYF